jgi:hypothetical protein
MGVKGMEKPLATIEEWAVVESVISEGYRELQPGNHLNGNVFGHQKFPNGKFIYTSAIVRVDLSKQIVETRNAVYLLGEPSDQYKTWQSKRRTVAA